MKQSLLLITLLFLSFSTLFSQDEKVKKFGAELSEIRKYKNQLDLDIKSVFNGFNSTSLLYKRTFQSGNLVSVNSISLFRLSARISNQINFTEDPTKQEETVTQVLVHPADILDMQIGLGFEKQKMNKRFVHYFGIDAIFGYQNRSSNYIYQNFSSINNAITGSDRLISTMRGGLNPFLGIKFYFTPRISLGIETGLALTYFQQTVTEFRYVLQTVHGFGNEYLYTESEPVVSKGIQTRFNNLRFLTVGYTF